MKSFSFGLSSLALLLPVHAGEIIMPAASNSGDWEWSISAGPSYRNVGQVKANTGYRSGGFALPSFVGDNALVVPPVGPADEYADREYNDGYLRQDGGTAEDGMTWYWGYESASQVQGDQLSYTATGFQSVFRDAFNGPSTGPASKDSLRGFSPHLQVDLRSPHPVGPFRLGFSGGFDFTAVDQATTFSNFSGTQFLDNYRLDYVDTYDLDGVIPPTAPYEGSFGGNGPLIGNIPFSRVITPVLLSTDVADFSNQVWSSIDINVFSFTFGPTLSRSWGPLDTAVSAGLILNIYDWQASQAEELRVTNTAGNSTVARWVEGDDGTKFRPGLYAQAEVAYGVGENLAISSFLRLDAAQEFRAQAGPTIYKIDPYGFNVGLQVRYALP